MKKIISLLTVIAVVCCCATGAFAFDTTTSNKMTADEETGLYTVSLSDLTSQYATVLAVKGTTISVGSIQYINQTDVSDGAATFSFALNEDRMTAETDTDDVYVLVGGGTSSSTYGVIKGEEDAPETFTISGSVVATIGTTLPVVTVTDGTSTYTATVLENGTYTISDVPAGSYTFTIEKAAHLTYTSPLTVSADTTIPAITVYAGNTDGNTGINVNDFTAVGTNFGSTKGELGDAFVKNADTDDNDGINVNDFTAVGVNFGKTTDDYTAIQ